MKGRDRDADDGNDRLDWPARGLSSWARRITEAFAEAILADEDDDGAIVPGSAEASRRAVDGFDHAIGRANPDVRRGIHALAIVLEWLPLFVVGAFSRMSRLPIERRVAYLDTLERHRIGLFAMLMIAFKVPLCITAFEEGDELALTGYDRPSTAARRDLVRLAKRAPIPERAAEEAS